MRRLTFGILITALICIFAITMVGCENKDEEIKIVKFEIQDLELVEGDTFDTSNVSIICHKSDKSTTDVENNLEFDKTNIKDKLDDNDVLSNNSAGEYIVPVYHLDTHIGDLKVIVKIKR